MCIRTTIFYLCFPFFRLLCSYQNNTSGCFRTINSSRGIFQKLIDSISAEFNRRSSFTLSYSTPSMITNGSVELADTAPRSFIPQLSSPGAPEERVMITPELVLARLVRDWTLILCLSAFYQILPLRHRSMFLSSANHILLPQLRPALRCLPAILH